MALVKDIADAIPTLVKLVTEIRARNVNLYDAEAAFNSLQAIAVDLGLEPPQVWDAVELVEAIAPLLARVVQEAKQSPPGPDVFESANGQ